MVVEKGTKAAQASGLAGRTLYIPQMGTGGAMAMAAAWRSIGVQAQISPDSDEKTIELASKYSCGEECFPESVTLGNFLKVLMVEKKDPKTVAFFMPTAGGPCRFGQYRPFLKMVLRQIGYQEAMVVSPSSKDGYQAMGEKADEFQRTAWRALVCADVLRKVQLKTRPYEIHAGDTDAVYKEGLATICSVLETHNLSHSERLSRMVHALNEIRDHFREVDVDRSRPRPLIGIVGEIFCRHNDFSNKELMRKIEEHGGECWLSDYAEWIFYTNNEVQKNLRLEGKAFSFQMLGAKLKDHVQRKDEKALFEPFQEDFIGLEEPHAITEVLSASKPYLPQRGALGEMVLSVGKAIYLHGKGADGVVDISPFSCMNGIISESVYPSVSRDFDGIPIRNFYFDEKSIDLDRDVGIFMELARHYQKKKKMDRVFVQQNFNGRQTAVRG